MDIQGRGRVRAALLDGDHPGRVAATQDRLDQGIE
jgi:hypothetical protein